MLSPQHYNIILLGATGVGKSSCGNTILGKNAFVSKKSLKPVTQKIQMDAVTVDGVTLHVYDTPGLFDLDRNNETLTQLESLLQSKERICTVVLLVMKADRLTPEDEKVLDVIEDFIPEFLIRNTWILFTRGDELEKEDLTIENVIGESDDLKNTVQRFENRYHVFNNISQTKNTSPDQVHDLIMKIKKNAKIYPKTPDSLKDVQKNPRRIVLLGKTGSGKSATGNTILGKENFKSEISSNSVTSRTEKEDVKIAGRKITVIDTPGIFDTTTKDLDKLAFAIGRSIFVSAPGPHAFLYVQPINIRFTEQEENVIKCLEMMFGKDMKKFTIIIFTYGDVLYKNKDIKSLILINNSLRRLVDECGGRYHVFNNTHYGGKQQVNELLQKIEKMVEENKGSYYSNEMFRDAERLRQEEKRNDEEFQSFYSEYKTHILAGLVAGAAIGGCIGGPVGAAIGSAVSKSVAIGAGVGAVTGAGIGAGIHKNLEGDQKIKKEFPHDKNA